MRPIVLFYSRARVKAISLSIRNVTPTLHSFLFRQSVDLDDEKNDSSYAIEQSDDRSLVTSQDDGIHMKRLPLISSTTATTFPVIYEVASDESDPSKSGISFASAGPSASSAGFNSQNKRRSTGTGSFERQLSILDPTSDRVSTILVWQNLVVSTRRQGRKEFFQRLCSSKEVKSTSKRLLHNVSGAITGGLWAVMGQCRTFFS